MTDQPSQRPDQPRPDAQWNDASPDGGTPSAPPSGYEPPKFVPPYGSDPYGPDPQGAGARGSGAAGPDVPPPPLYPGLSGQYGADGAGGQYAGSQPGSQQYGNPQYGGQYGGSPYGNQYPQPYGQQPYYGMPAEPRNLSIASMVCGIASVIMGWLILPQLAAIITGHMALKREPSGKGMSITGLVLGYLCLLGYGGFWLLLIIGLASYSTSYGY